MSLRPQYEWELLGADGQRLDRPAGPAFTGRFDAEQWLGEHWRALAQQDVTAAQLLHEGAPLGARLELTGPA